MFVLRDIESVFTDERRSSTYKIALITSIIAYVIENPEELPKNGYHQIPLVFLAKRGFLYYYPLMMHNPDIRQGNTQIFLHKAITNYATEVNDNFQDFDNCLSRLIQYRGMWSDDNTNLPLFKLLIRIREGIIEMPLQHIKVAGDLETDDKDRLLEKYKYSITRSNLFGLLTRINTHDSFSNYEESRKLASKWSTYGVSISAQTTWGDLIDAEFSSIMIGRHTYENLV